MCEDRLILGEDAIYSMDSNKTGVTNNVICVGGTGSGKTVSLLEPRLLETFNSSLIVTVTKRRIVEKYKPLFQERGYAVLDMNFIDPSASLVAYDPMKYVQSYADIHFLAESIVMADKRKERSTADPYWDSAAISLFSALIAYTLMTKKDATFTDVLTLSDNLDYRDEGEGIVTSMDERFKKLEEKGPCFATSCWRSFAKLPPKTAACVFSSMNTNIDTVFTPALRKMIETKRNVDIEALAHKKSVLFISTSAVNSALHSFVNMFYSQAFKTLFEHAEKQPDGRLPIPVSVLCDDFATGSPILNFPEYISIFREKGISVMLLLQSESQLENMYGAEKANTIIDNCDNYVFLGGMDLKTGRSVSQRSDRPLDEVLAMPIGQEFVFRRGQKPILTKRYNVNDHPIYQAITERYDKDVAERKEEER